MKRVSINWVLRLLKSSLCVPYLRLRLETSVRILSLNSASFTLSISLLLSLFGGKRCRGRARRVWSRAKPRPPPPAKTRTRRSLSLALLVPVFRSFSLSLDLLFFATPFLILTFPGWFLLFGVCCCEARNWDNYSENWCALFCSVELQRNSGMAEVN